MSTSNVTPAPRAPMDFSTRSMRLNTSRRKLTNNLVTGLAMLATALVILPLVAILVYLVFKGASSINLNFFIKVPAAVGQPGGGMANSIVGSAVMLGACEFDGDPGGDRGRRLSCRVWPGQRFLAT